MQHAKACVFDDTVVLTGANLSAEYFERRQDRYVVIRDAPALADVVCGVLAAVGARSTAYDLDGVAATKEHLGGAERKPLWPPPPADGVGEAQALASVVNAVVRAAADAHPPPAAGAAPPGGCWVLPAVQCAPAGLTTDADATEWLLRRNTKLPLALSPAYLNPPAAYEAAMLAACARGGAAVERAAPPRSAPQASGSRRAPAACVRSCRRSTHTSSSSSRAAPPRSAPRSECAATNGPGWIPKVDTTPRGGQCGRGSARRRCSVWWRLVQLWRALGAPRPRALAHARHHRRTPLSAELQAELDALRDHAVDADADDATEHDAALRSRRAAAAAFRTFF